MSDKSNTTENSQLVTMHSSKNLRMILLSMVILVAGIVIGSSGTMIIARITDDSNSYGPTIERAERFVRGLTHMLDLTEDQAETIMPITKTYFEKLDTLRKKNQPLITTIIKDMRKDIDTHLTEEQRETWKRKMERFQKGFRMYKGHGQGRGSGPHGPGSGRGMGPGGGGRMGPGPYGPGGGRGMGPGGGGRGPGRGFRPGPDGPPPILDEHLPPDQNLPGILP